MHTVAAIEFDFASKRAAPISPDEVQAGLGNGRCCWIDLCSMSPETVRTLLESLNVSTVAIDAACDRSATPRLEHYENCLLLTISEVSRQEDRLAAAPLQVLVGVNFIVTIHEGKSALVEHTLRTYRQDFLDFAKTLSFLLYEFWDHLIDVYHALFRELENAVTVIQTRIFQNQGDDIVIFSDVARLIENILLMRKLVLASRDSLEQLAVRKTRFVAESSQPYLSNLVGTLERLAADLTVEREGLAETVTLYLGIVSHRTNKVVNRLTAISAVFLPLMFLCGVYGMNFRMPEFEWASGPLYFWSLAAMIAIGIVTLMKYKKWL